MVASRRARRGRAELGGLWFGCGWRPIARHKLKLKDFRSMKADYWKLRALKPGGLEARRDRYLEWNKVGRPHSEGRLIAPGREGLAICEATSAALTKKIPWDKLGIDLVWQKALGDEGCHGIIELSPSTLKRLGPFTADRQSAEDVVDAIDGLKCAESVSGLAGLIARPEANLKVIEDWVAKVNMGWLLGGKIANVWCNTWMTKIKKP